MAEICSECLEIHRGQLYTLGELIYKIMREFENYKKITSETNTIVSVNKMVNNKALVFYNLYLKEVSIDIINKRCLIALSQPKYAIANLFLSLLINRKMDLII